MRRISTVFEIILSASLLVVGFYMLQEGISSKSTSTPAILIGGAVFFTVGAMTLLAAVRSILWHRHMLRQSMPKHELDTPAPGHDPG